MYSLDCKYFSAEFETIRELVDYCGGSMDPNYEVTKNGIGVGEDLIDFIVY